MKKLLTILLLIMLIISFFQITSMYALYKEKIQGEYATLLGAWNIKINTKDITTSGQVEKFTISDYQLGYISSKYIQAGKIAPGGQAYFDIVIDPSETDVSIIYQVNLESIDIPNAQIKLVSVDNLFKKDGETDVTNTQVKQNDNLYTAVIPIDKINDGYKNYLRLNFEWVNEDINSVTDTVLGDIERPTNKNITWTSNNPSVATISNGVVTAVSAGTATITATTEDGSYTDTCTVTVPDDKVAIESIMLDKLNLTLKKGQSEIVQVTTSPQNATNKNITWTSNNTSVATVTNGVITGVSAGTAIITATTVDGGHTTTSTVTVIDETVADPIAVESISLSRKQTTLKKGETEQVLVTILPQNATNKNITWTSSNPSVATVTNGIINAISDGTTTITITTADGSFTDTCTVTVSNEILAVSTVLDKTAVTLKKGETEILEAIVYPQNVTNKNITWTTNDENVATVSNGVITAVNQGTATITVTSADGSFTDTCTVTVSEETIATEDRLNVTGIDLDKKNITLGNGETEVLKPSIWAKNEKLTIPLEINLKQYTGEVIGNGS